MVNSFILIIAFIFAIVLLALLIPMLQLLIFRLRERGILKKILSKIISVNKAIKVYLSGFSLVDRKTLADRGWVRGPHGKVLDEDIFSKKKEKESEISLP